MGIFGSKPTRTTAHDETVAANAQLTPSGHPLPHPLHLELQLASFPHKGRLIIVGDVHGCYNELQLLLEQCEYKQGHDALFFVGDLVNKGPDSGKVLDWVSRANAYVTRGNHDEAALTAHGKQQRGEAIKPKFLWVEQLQSEQLAYLHSLPFTISFPELKFMVLHAGLLPGVALQQQGLKEVFKIRNVVQGANGVWQGLEDASEGGQAWAKVWKGPVHVFFGHDAKRRLQLETAATGLDTGCVYGNQLTAAILPPASEIAERVRNKQGAITLDDLGGEIVSVQALQAYEVKGKKNKQSKKEKPSEHAALVEDDAVVADVNKHKQGKQGKQHG